MQYGGFQRADELHARLPAMAYGSRTAAEQYRSIIHAGAHNPVTQDALLQSLTQQATENHQNNVQAYYKINILLHVLFSNVLSRVAGVRQRQYNE